jgi:hypothetical protein
MKMRLEGRNEFKAALRDYRKRTGDAFKQASEMAAFHIKDEAQQIVPVDTGALRASADYFMRGSGWGTVTIVGFGFKVSGYFDENGNPKVPRDYAVDQHEMPYRHPNGGEWLYLHTAVERSLDYVHQIYVGEIRRI